MTTKNFNVKNGLTVGTAVIDAATVNIAAGNITGGNLVSANYFSGNAANLFGIPGANVTGTVAAATIAGSVTNATQSNITTVGTLINLTVTGNVAAGNVLTNNLLYANGVAWDLQEPAGSNTQVQFNNNNDFGASSDFTFNNNTKVLTVSGNILGSNIYANTGTIGAASLTGTLTTASQPNVTSLGTLTSLNVSGIITGANITANTGVFTGNGSGLTALNASNVSTGTLAQARLANASVTLGSTALTLGSTITTVTGLVSVTSTTFVGSLTGAATTAGTVTTAAQGNITSVGTLTSLDVSGNITSGNVYANSGTIGASLLTGTLTTAAQPNITSFGTLTSLSVTGNISGSNILVSNGVQSNRGNVSIAQSGNGTTTIIDQFETTTYRTAKYIISAVGDDGFQSVETLLIHSGSDAFITIYGSICSNNTADIVNITSGLSNVTGNITLYASTASANTKVKLMATYVNI